MSARTTRAPCPQCDRGPRDQALAVTVDDRGTVMHCHRCGYTSANNIPSIEGISRAREIKHRPWQDLAAHLWNKAQPIKGTLAERYLQSRNCMLPPADGDLRFLPAHGKDHSAAMLARITDARTCEPISLHFTQLDGHGSKLGRRLLAGHRKAGGVVRLWPDETVTYSVGIAEGIETALSLAHGHSPVWAAVDAGNLATFPVLAGIETLVIATDGDDAGIESAATCGERWSAAGKNVLLVAASEMGCDLNDEVSA